MKRNKGRFNIIDLAVVVIIILLIVGAVYKFKGLEKTSTSVAMETITYEMTVESLREYAVDNILVGDTLFDYTSGNPIGVIKNIEWKDATEPLYTLDGKTVEAKVENRYDGIFTIEAEAVNNNGVYFVGKTYELCVNSKRNVYTKYTDCMAVITGINK